MAVSQQLWYKKNFFTSCQIGKVLVIGSMNERSGYKKGKFNSLQMHRHRDTSC